MKLLRSLRYTSSWGYYHDIKIFTLIHYIHFPVQSEILDLTFNTEQKVSRWETSRWWEKVLYDSLPETDTIKSRYTSLNVLSLLLWQKVYSFDSESLQFCWMGSELTLNKILLIPYKKNMCNILLLTIT